MNYLYISGNENGVPDKTHKLKLVGNLGKIQNFYQWKKMKKRRGKDLLIKVYWKLSYIEFDVKTFTKQIQTNFFLGESSAYLKGLTEFE